jgi:hypothetical protein
MHTSLFEQGNLLADCGDGDVELLCGASILQSFRRHDSCQIGTRVDGGVRDGPPSGGFFLLSSRMQLAGFSPSPRRSALRHDEE